MICNQISLIFENASDDVALKADICYRFQKLFLFF